MTHITCRLTHAKNRDQLQNRTLCNRVWAILAVFYCLLCILHHLIGKNRDFTIGSKVDHSISQRRDHKSVQGLTFTPAALCYRDTCCDVVFFVCQSVTSQCSIKTSGPIELFLLCWLPMTFPKCIVRNFLILAAANILSDITCLHGPSA